MYLKIHHLDHVKFLWAPGFAWQAALKKTEVKLELLADIDMLLMVLKGIKRWICHAIYWYATIYNKLKIIIKIKNHHIFNISI